MPALLLLGRSYLPPGQMPNGPDYRWAVCELIPATTDSPTQSPAQYPGAVRVSYRVRNGNINARRAALCASRPLLEGRE